MTDPAGQVLNSSGDTPQLIASALESLGTEHRALAYPEPIQRIAAAIYEAIGGQPTVLATLISLIKEEPLLSLDFDGAPPIGICVEGCPPERPAHFREFVLNGSRICICDHVPTHRFSR